MKAGSSRIASERQRAIAPALLSWYDRHHRDLPWRVPPRDVARGVRPDPYRVWLSEIMLQQTTVEAVKPFFARFVALWPSVGDLAASEPDEVMRAWAGLGYYSRARNLHACARTVAEFEDARFPDTEEGLRALPGIGAYTAAAIAAIAFDRAAVVVDGNVERVVSRLYAIATPLPEAKAEIRLRAAELTPSLRPGDFAQAMMDLGATICTPKRPKCMLCPITEHCDALAAGDPEHYPVKAQRAEKPLREGAAYVAVAPDGAVLLRKRPERGLLGGMAEPPTSGWDARKSAAVDAEAAPFPADWRPAGAIRHTFTHFELTLTVHVAHLSDRPQIEGHWWSPPGTLHAEALPTVMKKAIEAALPGATRRRREES